MSAPARLLSVRLQGFKSFAERTLVTFGPGISAVVGPNGSGKSNLADALRWSLGEQGRALRSRRAEDVVWAGSESRAAVGMADVQLTLDNVDGLLPVDFGVVELGRRLYRSGENEYLLNRQRVRLRDLVDLLDAAHLAENAFLFIGQGMVDQALALRPEERRPLFEEVAGVRRHERRRRRAEEQLAESEANLARVADILAELRPLARRLAIQAEQQQTRASAGDDLAAALLLAAHVRWHEVAVRIQRASARLAEAREREAQALAGLEAAEAQAASLAGALAERGSSATELRRQADEARAALTQVQLREGQLAAEAGAIARDRERLAAERAATEADLAAQRRRVAEPIPPRDEAAEAALSEAERALADALAELAALQAASRARDADLAALRRAAAARATELETARRRVAEAERAAAAEAARASEIATRLEKAEAARAAAAEELAGAVAAERTAAVTRTAAEAALEQRSAEARAAVDRASGTAAELAAIQARRAARAATVADDAGSGVAAKMRGRGGRRVDEDLVVDIGLRAAVDAALAGAGRAYLATRHLVGELAGERGVAVVADVLTGERPTGATVAFLERLRGVGGGLLLDAVRRDGTGAARRLLARAAWTPDLDAALAVQPELPPGWIAVPRDGSAVVGEVVVRLGGGDRLLEGRAELDRVEGELAVAETAAVAAVRASELAATAAAEARTAHEAARAAEARATETRRAAEDRERLATRSYETVAREAGWHVAQAARLAAEAERARAALPPEAPAGAGDEPGADDDVGRDPSAASTTDPDAIRTWEARAAELRARRDRLAAAAAEADGHRRDAERRRAGAEAAIAMDEARLAAAERAEVALAVRERELDVQRAAIAAELADARVRDAEARGQLDRLLEADAADRARLTAAERDAHEAREAFRTAEERSRAAEREDLEAQLGREALREQLLAELDGLGTLGLRHIAAVTGLTFEEPGTGEGERDTEPAAAGGEFLADTDTEPDAAARLAAALDAAADRWSASPAQAEAPTPARLATLRRRYHELGSAGPDASEDYAAVRTRLEDLERQHDDLQGAIARTRALIAELDTLIGDQFRSTFRALEASFDARFRQLFGGGYAQLALTDPTDLAATGVEITARPPGKKPQALAMLSGGERALTAVALLFAMLEVRPVPFCVLDEVDAALDEANVGRFTAALRQLAEQTQFIVITHNRGTIEIADALYGVTVGDDSVSRVISLRLDEATEIAERHRPAAAAVGPAPDVTDGVAAAPEPV